MSDDNRNASVWMAIGPWRAPAENVQSKIEQDLATVGLEPRDEWDDDHDQVTCLLVRQKFDDLWLKLRPAAVNPEMVIRTLAHDLPNSLNVYTVVARSGSSGFETNPEAYDIEADAVRLTTDGQRRSADFPGTAAPEEVPALEREALAAFFVDRAINDGQEGEIEEVAKFFMQSTGQDDDLEPRLADIVADVRRAAGYKLEEMAGQTLIKLELPDGTDRMSAITDDEIETIIERTGVEPSE